MIWFANDTRHRPAPSWSGWCCVALLALGAVFAAERGPEPLHARIDRIIESGFAGPLMPAAGDADFVRRVHLDLAGVIPTAVEARAFLADTAPDKRAKLVDRLLATRAHARHLATVFDVMLMERRAEKNAKAADWQQFLFESFATNKPYNQLVRDILAADSSDEKRRPAARFLLDREAEANLLTRDVGRVFFGMDLQCAQCHDHPRIEDFRQRDYHGLHAFLNRTYLFTDAAAKKSFVGEKPDGDVQFTSVFTKIAGDTAPRLPGGTPISEPRIPKGEEYLVKPDPKNKALLPVPKYSRRELLARVATDGTNRAFNCNAVNRLWAHMMGRGLVDPVDELHSSNPPAYPALLDVLAEEFVAMQFDTRALLRELALTKVYQRSSEVPALVTLPPRPAPKTKSGKPAPDLLARMQTEQQQLAGAVAAHDAPLKKLHEDMAANRKALVLVKEELGKTNAAIAEVRKPLQPVLDAADAAESALKSKRDALKVAEAELAKAQEAVTAKADDKTLAGVEKTKMRMAELGKEITAGEKDWSAKKTTAQPNREKLAVVEATAQPLRDRLAVAQKTVVETDNQLTEEYNRRHADKTAARDAERRLADAQFLADYEAVLGAANAAKTELVIAEFKLEAARDVLARQAALTEAQQASDKAESELKEAKQQFAAKTAEARKNKEPANADVAQFKQVVSDREAAAKAAKARLADAKKAFDKVARQLAAAKRDLPVLEQQLKATQLALAAEEAKLSEPLAKLTETLANAFAVGGFTALTPEQLGWSMMQAAGVVQTQQSAAEAEFDKKTPVTDTNRNDPARAAERAKFVEQTTWDKLKGNLGQFVSLFGNGAGQPQDAFYATADQALFFSNGGLVRGWLAPSGGNLGDRLNKAAAPAALADELYLSVLTRRPTEAETAAVEKYLAAPEKEKPAAVQELAWALLTSAEFRFRR